MMEENNYPDNQDWLDNTRPGKSQSSRPMHEYQRVYVRKQPPKPDHPQPDRRQKIPQLQRNRPKSRLRLWIFLAILLGFYFLYPSRTNVLIMGTDYLPHREVISRTDTMMLMTVNPTKPYVGILAIPRDLWVSVPGVGESRINTAYFYAEASNRGSGPAHAVDTVRKNFGLTLQYYIVLKMEGLVKVVDALGGIEISLEKPMGGLLAGKYRLNGAQALAFARERYSGDDFSRMGQGQLIIKSILQKSVHPFSWPRIPFVLMAAVNSADTNIPVLFWPRLGLAILRAGPEGIDMRTITRDMVIPFQTFDGAHVLGPNWMAINPVLLEMFDE